MNKNESKYFNTAIKMDKALITLLEKKDFEYITVKEICNVAGVNRSTFYLHYDNISDLLKETTRYIFDKLISYYSVNMQNIEERFKNRNLGDLIFVTSGYLTPYLEFVKENKLIFKVSVKQFHSMNMNEAYDKMFKHIFDPILARFCVPENQRAYAIKFYLTGIFAIVMEWLDKDCTDDIDIIIKVITECVMGGRNIDEKAD